MLSKSLDIFSTTIGKKLLVAVTGLLFFLFLVFHLLNNLIIFTGPENFNQLVAALEKIKPLIRVMEFLLLIIFITHIYNSILLTVKIMELDIINVKKVKKNKGILYLGLRSGKVGYYTNKWEGDESEDNKDFSKYEGEIKNGDM